MHNHLIEIKREEVVRSLIDGLNAPRKRIPSIYFYDASGSKLFEQITQLPEYYLSRTEKRLLHQLAPHLFDKPGQLNIIEIGSGDCSKISILLSAIPKSRRRDICYLPVDVSGDAIHESAKKLQRLFPEIRIHGLVADFTRQMHLIPRGKNMFCFLGSTIGNLSREQRSRFFHDLGRIMSSGDVLLLGVDLIKPVDILEKAYNDEQGITAAFNRNILNVVNDLTGTDFDPEAFDHLAFYNPRRYRIEMHLQANKAMRIVNPVMNCRIRIEKGETIHTENSRKFTLADIRESAATAGLFIKDHITDNKGWYSLMRLLKE